MKGVSKWSWLEPKEKNVIINKLRHNSGFFDFQICRGAFEGIEEVWI
ncbi:MAG: hypothetical protein IKV83_08040 [Muribaculaceae bacterium]|nr:hypothetical protein [Muribaculaceae bacterium]